MSLIDIHFHGIEKFDISRAKSYEVLLMISEELAKRGIDAFMCTLYPNSLEKLRENLTTVKKAMTFNRVGAKILGAYLEGPFLNPEKAGALDRAYLVLPNLDYLRRLVEDFEKVLKIITVAPELPEALKVIEKASEQGFIVSLGHSDGTFKEAEDAFRAGAKLITHLFNAMRGIHHREPGLAGFGLINQEIYVELIGDGRHIDDRLLRWIFTVKNPERIILVSDLVIDPGEGSLLKGGYLDLSSIKRRLIDLGFEKDKVDRATRDNAGALLGLSFL